MKKIIIVLVLIILFLIITIKHGDNQKSNCEKITFASWGSQTETQIVKNIINKFEKEHKNIKVEFIHIPQNYFQKLHLLYASNLEPDVIFINNQNIELYTHAGLLEDLTGYFPDIDNTYHKVAIDCFKNNNGLYAIPRDISNLVLYYNKDIFNKQKVSIPQEIHNIEDLKNLANKVTTKSNFGINFEEDPLYWLYYLASNGGGIISDDKKTIIANNRESIDALKLYADFINTLNIAPNKAQVGSMTTAQMFINGKIAIYLGGRWMFPKFNQLINFNWDVISFPANNKNKVYVDASGWALSKRSKNKDKAIELIKYLSSYEASEEFIKSGLIVPARKDLTNKFINLDSKNRIFIEMLENTKPTPVNYNYRKINDILKEKSQKIFSGDIESEKIFNKNEVKELESLLK